jgi:hypothetical protein
MKNTLQGFYLPLSVEAYSELHKMQLPYRISQLTMMPKMGGFTTLERAFSSLVWFMLLILAKSAIISHLVGFGKVSVLLSIRYLHILSCMT